MISLTAEYALRAVVWLASEAEGARTTRQIAEGTRVPQGYLSKVLQSLSRTGVLRSQRGLGGGFRLVIPATELTAWDVVDAVDPVQRIRECPLGIPGHRTELCPLHRRLDAAIAMVEDALRTTTIATLLTVPVKGKPRGKPTFKPKGRRGRRRRS